MLLHLRLTLCYNAQQEISKCTSFTHTKTVLLKLCYFKDPKDIKKCRVAFCSKFVIKIKNNSMNCKVVSGTITSSKQIPCSMRNGWTWETWTGKLTSMKLNQTWGTWTRLLNARCLLWILNSFWVLRAPKSGLNYFFQLFQPFLFISKLFQCFHAYNQQKRLKNEHEQKTCFFQILSTPQSW